MSVADSRPWLKKYPEGVRPNLEYPNMTMPDFLEKSARGFPDNKAIIFAGVEITYQVLAGMVAKFATALSNLGVKKGDRVALMAPNCPHYVVGYYAIQKLGAIVVQVNPMYVERELEHILSDSGAEVIIVYDALYPVVKRVRPVSPLKKVIVFSLGQPAGTADEDCLLAEKLLQDSPPLPPNVEHDVVNDVAVLQYTGGTTGVSKGAMLTHRNIVANAMQMMEWDSNCEYGQEVVLSVLPFFHSYGMTCSLNFPVMNASTMVVLPKFDLQQAMEAIKKYSPTVFPGVPTMYIAINNFPNARDYGVESIKTCISGSAPLPVEVSNKFEELTGGHLVEGYGLSESSPITHCNPLKGERRVGSIGLPFPDTEARIVDVETGEKELPPGETGELIVKGPQVMKGYWNMPGETKQALRNGWLYTGDIGKMDEDGYFYIVDRKKDMVVAGGFNIYPREIEEVLFEHPKVREAVVVGVPDPYRGETVKAYVVLKEGESCGEEEIIDYCRDKLAKYKLPRLVEFRDELPKTIVGKVLRRMLREEEMKKLENKK